MKEAPCCLRVCVHREGSSYGGPAPPPLTLLSNGALLLWWSQASSHSALVMGHHSLGAPHAVFIQPTLVLSLALTSKAWTSAPPECLRQWCAGQWHWSSVRLSASPSSDQLLCFSLRLWGASSIPADFPASQGPPRVQIPFLLHRCFSGVLVTSWILFFPYLSFSFCSTQSCGRSPPFGSLRSSSIH